MKAQEVRRLAQRKIEEIDPGLSELTAIRSDLVVLVETCKAVATTEDCVMMAAMDDDDTAAAWCSSTA